MLSTEYGVRLKSPCDCWAADLGVTDSTNPNEVQVQFQLTLGGLGSGGAVRSDVIRSKRRAWWARRPECCRIIKISIV